MLETVRLSLAINAADAAEAVRSGVVAKVSDNDTLVLDVTERLDAGQKGVPMLDKIPHINRLFKNAPASRERTFLFITPHVIVTPEVEAPAASAPAAR